MIFEYTIMVILTYLPLAHLSHQSSQLHTEQFHRDTMAEGNLPLGETIAAVDASEVKTLPENTSVSQVNTDRLSQFPRRHWRRRPSWRRLFNGWSPDLPFRDVNGFNGHQIGALVTPNNFNQQQIDHDHTRKILDIRTPGAKKTDHIQDTGIINEIRNIKKDINNPNINQANKAMIQEKKMSHSEPNSTALLGGILQKITKQVVSGLVDKLANKIIGAKQQNNAIHGTPQQIMVNGHGLSQPFAPVAHTHGPNGEVIPLIDHGDHLHSEHGQIIPNVNRMQNGFGRRQPWNRNPFFHSSIQGSQRGWVIG